MNTASNSIVTPGIYRHYKGQDYQVLDVARHSENQEYFVVYRCLYGDYSLWIRPLAMFIETIEFDGKLVPRFALVEPAGQFAPDADQ